jgi:hypothetical protein
MPIIDNPARTTVKRVATLGRTNLWPSWRKPGSIASDAGATNVNAPLVYFPAPVWFLRAWEAGEPLEPLLDWLVEQYGTQYPFLEKALSEAIGG